jgi:hypothetical protein
VRAEIVVHVDEAAERKTARDDFALGAEFYRSIRTPKFRRSTGLAKSTTVKKDQIMNGQPLVITVDRFM